MLVGSSLVRQLLSLELSRLEDRRGGVVGGREHSTHTSVGLADMCEGHRQRSRSRQADVHELQGWIEFARELLGAAGTQPVVELADLFDEDSGKARRVLFPDPSNGFGDEVFCVQLDKDSFEDCAHLGAKLFQRLLS